ncbi:MAG: GNAT family N-acetyltransferase, partial [Pseudonocardia sp.]|nr:GNAT family N-acetyltransferase [Pseudonocardia sp.]
MAMVRTAEPADVPRLADLLDEMGRFYGDHSDERPAFRVRHVEQALFGDGASIAALLAVDGDDVIGLASYSFLWPAAGLTRSLYLKELYVRQRRRSQGTGRALMHELISLARREGCSRVEWTTEDGNDEAKRF